MCFVHEPMKRKVGKSPRGHAAVKEESSIYATGKPGRFGE